MSNPTIAEERIAKAIACFHGSALVFYGKTVAALHGYGAWGHSPENYAENHWREYLGAARAVLEMRS